MSNQSRVLHAHTRRIKNEYEDHLVRHDPDSPEAAHWIGREKTWLRMRVLTEIGDLNGMKLLDFGCGTGLLLDFLKERAIDCEYHGWDISKRMIEVARRRHPTADFSVVDVLTDELSKFAEVFDYVIVSGVFYIKTRSSSETHRKWTEAILTKLWPLCSRGIATNFLTEYVEWKEPGLYYCPLGSMIRFCNNNLSRWFVVRHDYTLWEFTVYVFRDPRVSL